LAEIVGIEAEFARHFGDLAIARGSSVRVLWDHQFSFNINGLKTGDPKIGGFPANFGTHFLAETAPFARRRRLSGESLRQPCCGTQTLARLRGICRRLDVMIRTGLAA
jgi:hypothetical protein